MKFLQHVNKPQTTAVMVLLWAILCVVSVSIAFSHTVEQTSNGFAALVGQVDENPASVEGAMLAPVPTDGKFVDIRSEAELNFEEEDSNEDDDASAGIALKHESNCISVQTIALTTSALTKKSGPNPLYILYHSLKIFIA